MFGLLVIAMACGKKSDPTPAADPAVEAAKPATPATCETGLQRLYDAIQKTGLPDEKAANTPETLADRIRQCKSQPWPPAMVSCMNQIDSVEAYMSRCYKAAFSGDIELKLVRELDASVDLSEAVPPVFAIEGDFVVFDKGAHCGLVSKKLLPVEAVFVVCGGRVLAGPFTTPAEVDQVAADLRAVVSAKGSVATEIPKKYPAGCATCRYSVHDAAGKLVGP